MTFVLIAKLSLTLFYSILLIYTLEIFPTKMRTKGFSYCYLFGKVAASIMPFVLTYAWNVYFSPVFLLGLLGVILFFLCIKIKEP